MGSFFFRKRACRSALPQGNFRMNHRVSSGKGWGFKARQPRFRGSETVGNFSPQPLVGLGGEHGPGWMLDGSSLEVSALRAPTAVGLQP